jgi:hypothetical protein
VARWKGAAVAALGARAAAAVLCAAVACACAVVERWVTRVWISCALVLLFSSELAALLEGTAGASSATQRTSASKS